MEILVNRKHPACAEHLPLYPRKPCKQKASSPSKQTQNICTMLDQRRRRWAYVVQMFCVCWDYIMFVWVSIADLCPTMNQHWAVYYVPC